MNSSPSSVIADQVRHHRNRLGMTREQLAAECAKLGAPELTYAAITNIETGRNDPKTGKRRREVTVEELLLLGTALGVPPLLLFLPLGERDTVPVLPDQPEQHPHAVWKWMTGEGEPCMAGPDGRLYADTRSLGDTGKSRVQATLAAGHAARLYRELQMTTDYFNSAHGRYVFSLNRFGPEAEQTQDLRSNRLGQMDALAGVLNRMTEAGVRPPAQSLTLMTEMRGLELLTTPDAIETIDDVERTSDNGQ